MIHTIITTSVNNVDTEIIYSFFYGNPKRAKRLKDWLFIEEIAKEVTTSWMLTGDLNLTLDDSDKKGGNPVNFSTSPIQYIRNIIADFGFLDL